ncbi:class I SAM-dependent methyltransferase [Myxococcota bacterium]|nr:class I SAM-dependent methyltransferase [Myxococcota bacterium]
MIVDSAIAFPVLRAAYMAQQASMRIPITWTRTMVGALLQQSSPDEESLKSLQEQYWKLLETDLLNVEKGIYPASLLFQMPLREYAWQFPRFLADLPRTLQRIRDRRHQDVPRVDKTRFPAYFRRTFHWQTDGYLSRRSADLYDVSVELVFLGCADVMRRQVIPPMARFLSEAEGRPLRVLDVGCGTGRTLHQIATAIPGHQYFGLDMSPFYIENARSELAQIPEVSLVAENAEALPYRTGYFDIVTSVYLFHELPRQARRRVLTEIRRVLRPGGLLVVEDSAQLAEAEDLSHFLEFFHAQMHEPFYRDYLRDDLAALLEETGFVAPEVSRAWLSKVVNARVPDCHD